MDFTHYNKFWVAAVGFIIIAINNAFGIDLAVIGVDATGIVSFVTAILVYAIPNTSYKTTETGAQIN